MFTTLFNKFKNYKSWIIIGIFICVIVFVLFQFKNSSTEYEFDFEKVQLGDVIKTISTTGTIELLNPVAVLCQVNGVVKKVFVDFNQSVSKDQLLAIIDAGNLENDISKMRKTIERYQIDLGNMEKDLEIKRSMFKENLISAGALEIAENEYKKLQLAYSQILVDYKNLINMQKNTKVLAPINGIIVSRDINESDPVYYNKRLFLMVESLKTMQIIVSIDETDIGRVKTGQMLRFTVNAYPERVFSGKIVQVRFNPINRGGVITYDAVALCDNPDSLLKPGMTAIVTVEADVKNNVMKVPNEALTVVPPFVNNYKLDKTKKYVWKKRKKDIIPIEVTIGLYGDRYSEIKSNKIKPGELVLTRVRKKLSIKK